MPAASKKEEVDSNHPCFRDLIDASDKRSDDLANAEIRRIHELTEAERRRLDDLRDAIATLHSVKMEAESKRVTELMTLRADYSKQLDEAESKRIDAIRAVDVAAVAVASERATQQASVLANQVVASAETLRTLVASTAATVAQQLAQLSSQLSDRLSALEKSQYEGIGRGRIADPAMAELMGEVKRLRESSSVATGSTSGQYAVWGAVVVIIGLVLTAGGIIASVLLRRP